MATRESPEGTLGKGALAGYARWREAMRWQRAVNRALKPLGLTHTQLLVLSATVSAFDDDMDGATQAAIAKHAGLDHVTTGAVLEALEGRDLVTRDVVADDKRSWSVSATARGRRTLASAVPLVERVAQD